MPDDFAAGHTVSLGAQLPPADATIDDLDTVLATHVVGATRCFSR